MAEVFYRNDNRSSFGYGVINNAYDYFNGVVQITESGKIDVNSLIRFVCNSQDWGYLWVDYEDYLEASEEGAYRSDLPKLNEGDILLYHTNYLDDYILFSAEEVEMGVNEVSLFATDDEYTFFIAGAY